MSVKRYGPGEHPSGFIGYRVTVYNGRRWREKYFSLRCPFRTMSDEFWDRYQSTRARYFEVLCQKHAAAVDYLKFVKTAHANAATESSLGVHSLSLFIERSQKSVLCGFFVSYGRDGGRRFTISEDGDWFSSAYRNAVNHWADYYQIRDKDRERLLENPPEPTVFQALRRHLSDGGDYITPSEISEVFREQRTEFARQRAAKAISAGDGSPDATDIAYWFEREIDNTA